MRKIAAVLLAVDEEALAVVDGQRRVDRDVKALREGGCGPIVVVTGQAPIELLGGLVVSDPHWRDGPGSGVRTGLDALRSITRPGVVTIYVDLEGTFPPEDVGEVWQEVRNRMGDIRHTLPPGVVGPFFNDDFGDVFGIVYGLTFDGYSWRQARDFAEAAKSAFLSASDTGKVEIYVDE